MKVKILLLSTYYLTLQTYETNGGRLPCEMGVSGEPLDDEKYARDDRGQEQKSRPVGGGNMPPPKDPPKILPHVNDFEWFYHGLDGLPGMDDRDHEKPEEVIDERKRHSEFIHAKLDDLSDEVKYKVKKMEETDDKFESMKEDTKYTKANYREGL